MPSPSARLANGGCFLFRFHLEMIRAKDDLIRGIRLGQQDFLDQALNPDGTIHALLVDPADLVERVHEFVENAC